MHRRRTLVAAFIFLILLLSSTQGAYSFSFSSSCQVRQGIGQAYASVLDAEQKGGNVLKRLKQLGDRVYGVLTRGAKLAWSFSQAAVSWDNESAKEWRNDRSYILYLGSCLLGCKAWRPAIWSGGRA
jgi:hypothetical protein